MENPFKLGDIVVLKSGSPKMVIYDINEGYIECCYFDKAINSIADTKPKDETDIYPKKPYFIFELYDPSKPSHNRY